MPSYKLLNFLPLWGSRWWLRLQR